MGATTRSGNRSRAWRLVAAGLVVASAALGVALIPPSTAGATSWGVTNCNDSGPGSLRQAVTDAASGDSVGFTLSPPCSVITLDSTIDIDTDLTILGPGATELAVSGNHAVGVFNIHAPGLVDISGLTIEDGNATDGGGIYGEVGTTVGVGPTDLSVFQCTLTGNSATDGGAIFNQSGQVDIQDSTVSDNSATNGAGVYDDDGVETNIGNSTVSGNTATGDGGGVDNVGTTMIVSEGSAITGNSAGDGGGVYNDTSASDRVEISQGVISANSATDGGGIDNEDGPLSVAGTVSGNTAGDGGGVFNDVNGSLTVYQATLSGNSATDGGGIDTDGTTAITASTVSANTAGTDGGGIDTDGTTAITAGTVSDNGAPGAGGNIDNSGGSTRVAGTIVAGAEASSDCSGTITDAGYNLEDDSSCGFVSADHSLTADPDLGPLQNNGGETDTQAPALGSPVLNVIPVQTKSNGVTLCPSLDQRNDFRPWGTGCDIGALELVGSQAITSADAAGAVVHSHFSFTVTTTGTPVPRITKRRPLPPGLKFVDNRNGTATISGTPRKAGIYNFGVRAQWESGTGADKIKNLVGQSFTLTVTAPSP